MKLFRRHSTGLKLLHLETPLPRLLLQRGNDTPRIRRAASLRTSLVVRDVPVTAFRLASRACLEALRENHYRKGQTPFVHCNNEAAAVMRTADSSTFGEI